MSVFANEQPGQGMRVGPGVETEDSDGFNQFGKPVPMFRRQAAMNHLKEMGVDSKAAFDVSSRMAEAVERDEPHRAMEIALEVVDVTGVYRALAVMCAATE